MQPCLEGVAAAGVATHAPDPVLDLSEGSSVVHREVSAFELGHKFLAESWIANGDASSSRSRRTELLIPSTSERRENHANESLIMCFFSCQLAGLLQGASQSGGQRGSSVGNPLFASQNPLSTAGRKLLQTQVSNASLRKGFIS